MLGLSLAWISACTPMETLLAVERSGFTPPPGTNRPYRMYLPLRVVAGLALCRGRLRYVYQVLRGKDISCRLSMAFRSP